MKASVKFREEERKGPLIRAKVPVSVLGFPLAATAAAGDPDDLSLHLRTALSGGPSLKLTYRPNPTLTTDHPFSLTLKSGVGPWGSPDRSPLLISAHLSLPSLLGGSPADTPSFTIQIKPQIGDFSLKKTVASPPNPNPSKMNGGGVHHPLPMARRERTGLEDLLSSGVAVSARTTLPVTRRAGVSFRWGVNVSEAAVSGWRRLPYLTVDKISIETTMKEGNGGVESMGGMWVWMRREVEELQRENRWMKERIEEVRMKVLKGRGVSGGVLEGLKKSSIGVSSSRGVEKGGSKPVDAATGSRGGSSNGRSTS